MQWSLPSCLGVMSEKLIPDEPLEEPPVPQRPSSLAAVVTPEMDRLNGSIFFISYILIYLAAPVFYVDVVQAALCDKLGANHTVASLPAAAYYLGSIAPIVLAQFIPYRLEREAVVGIYVVTAALMGAVCVALILPLSNTIKTLAVVSQGLVLGVTNGLAQVYCYACLGRGCTTKGRARAYKLAFGIGPVAAVLGSLGSQFVLNHGIHFLAYPYDFAALYFAGTLSAAGVAGLSSRYKLVPVQEEQRPPVFRYILDSLRSYLRRGPLVWLLIGYLLWYSTLSATPNLGLYTREAMGREPQTLSGYILALRFGCKSLAGYFLGWMTARWGDRLPVITTTALVGSATLWAWVAPGYWYLLAFGLMGAGELGGAYFPNYALSFSAPGEIARNQSILMLATPLASLSPLLHGALTERFGFRASFLFGTVTAALGLWLAVRLPAKSAARTAAGEGTGP